MFTCTTNVLTHAYFRPRSHYNEINSDNSGNVTRQSYTCSLLFPMAPHYEGATITEMSDKNYMHNIIHFVSLLMTFEAICVGKKLPKVSPHRYSEEIDRNNMG